jgi:hypothetical protein
MLPTTLFEKEMTTLSQDVAYRYTNLRSSRLDNDTRNTRTFDTFNIKGKVVLAKIPAHFLVGDRRPNVLYARLRRNCSSLTK